MIIRKGNINDINEIMDIIKNVVIDMERRNIYQWDSIYPNEEVISQDMISENLFVYIDGNIIKGFIVLNEHQDKEYETIDWKFTSGRQLVIHRLCINPAFQGHGIARYLVEYVNHYAMDNNYASIRLDAFIKNERACQLYEKAGYRKAGIVTFRKGNFYCFEKDLV